MNQKIIVFYQRQNDLWYVYGMLEFANWERFLVFDTGFKTKNEALEETLIWKNETNKETEIYIDFHTYPSELKRLDKTVIYFKRAWDNHWYVKFLFKYAGIWHYVFLSNRAFTAQSALYFAENWRANNRAIYEIYISEEIFS